MITETYNGVSLKVRALKGSDWGRVQQVVNGVEFFKSLGTDERQAIDQLKRSVDAAHERPEAYPDYWKAK